MQIIRCIPGRTDQNCQHPGISIKTTLTAIMKYGFAKIASASPVVTVADCKSNAGNITNAIEEAYGNGAELMLLPELCITSCSCGDLYTHPHLIKEAEKAITAITASTREKQLTVVVGTPAAYRNSIYNCSAVIFNGEVLALVPQENAVQPFTSGRTLSDDASATIDGKKVPFIKRGIFTTPSFIFGIEIGADALQPVTPGAELAMAGAQVILNPADGKEKAGTNRNTRRRLEQASEQYRCCYVHASAGWGESTSNAVHSGYCAIAEEGEIIAESGRFAQHSQSVITETDIEKVTVTRRGNSSFATDSNIACIEIPQVANDSTAFTRKFTATPFTPFGKENNEKLYEEIFTIQANALARRITHTHSKCCVIGISGGLDSTLALLVTARACKMIGKPMSDIIAVTMPGFGTSDRTYNNALTLMRNVGATIKEISIKEACIQHFKDIDHDINNHDVTYENSQARERTQILMDIANQQNGIVVGTGDLSELALGWATYNGDHMSMYSVNATVPKTLMQHIVCWAAHNVCDENVRDTLLDIIDTPISPELTPADDKGNIKQKTEDLVGPYILHDFFIYHFLRYGFSPEKIHAMACNAFEGEYDSQTIKKWLATFMRRFFTQQFKRSCMPDGPDTGFCSLNPQSGWRMTSDTSGTLWTTACEEIRI